MKQKSKNPTQTNKKPEKVSPKPEKNKSNKKPHKEIQPQVLKANPAHLIPGKYF